jgi:hypothetical protein
MWDTSSIRILEVCPPAIESVREAIRHGLVSMIIPRTVSEQLWCGHHAGHGPGIPPFECEYVGNTVARVGLLAVGDSIGEGKLFDQHLGMAYSNARTEDALIVDAFQSHADVLVSDDIQLRRLTAKCLPGSRVLSLQEFLDEIRTRSLGSARP